MLSSSINPEVGNMLLKNIERFLQDYKNDIYGGKQVDYSDIYYLWLIMGKRKILFDNIYTRLSTIEVKTEDDDLPF